MGKRAWLLAAALVLAATAASAQVRGFGGRDRGREAGFVSPAPATEPAAAQPEGTSADPVASRIEALDLRQRAAQLMLVTMEGSPSPNAKDLHLLNQYTPGGVLLPPLLRPGDARDYVERLRSVPAEEKTGIALLLGTNLYDLPKGRNEPNAFFFQLPSMLTLAAANDATATAQLGDVIARQLTAMGLNMNLGPSLELAPSLSSVRGSVDCLGSDPKFSAEAGGAIMKALLDRQIVAVPMGFPGGGSNRRPNEPAVLVTPAKLLEERDLLPYRRAIELGAPAVHVSNTYVPLLEPGRVPASLSPAVMRDLLRQKLGFQGVVIAGPMDTNDVALVMDPTKAAVASLKAGADMILWNEAGSRVMKTVDDIVKAVNAGELSQDVLNAALRRVLELKEKQGLLARTLPKGSEAEKLERDKDIPKTVYAIERQSITLVANRGNVLPLNKKDSIPVGITGEVGVDELHTALSEYMEYVVQQPIRSAKHSGRILDFEISRLTAHDRGLKTAVCVFADNGETASKKQLIRAMQEKGMRVVVVLLGYPSSLPAMADADAILLAYCKPSAYAQTMRAVADVLVGQGPVAVMPTVRDLKATVGQDNTFNPLDVIQSPAGRLPVSVGEQFPAGLFVPYDPTFTLKKVVWDFGDGEKSKEFVAKHAYKAPGRYPVALNVTDKKGNSTSRTFYVVVE